MSSWTRSLVRAGPAPALLLVLILAPAPLPRTAAPPRPAAWAGTTVPAPVPACREDVSPPLEARAVVLDPLAPGARVRVRLEVTAHRLIDGVRIEVPGGAVRARVPEPALGLLRRGETRSQILILILPHDRLRRTVDLRVSGDVDGLPVTRGATVNLDFDPEPSRLVTAPDGRRIREVPATRIE